MLGRHAALYHSTTFPNTRCPKSLRDLPPQKLEPVTLCAASPMTFHARVALDGKLEIRTAQEQGPRSFMESREAGLCLVADNPRTPIYMFNHIEYDTNSLATSITGCGSRQNHQTARQLFPGGILCRTSKIAGAATHTCYLATGLTRFTSPRPSGWKTLVNHKFSCYSRVSHQ